MTKNFDLKSFPYIFFRTRNSIQFLNLDMEANGEYRLTMLTTTTLDSWSPLQYPPGSIMSVQNQNNTCKLFTLEVALKENNNVSNNVNNN